MKKFLYGCLLLCCLIMLVPQSGLAGKAASGETGFKTEGKNVFYYKNGVMQKKWLTIGGKKYYFSKSGAMLKGWQKINKKWYHFNSKGVFVGTKRNKTIVLDPGHSGKMPGGVEPLGPGSGEVKAKDAVGTQGVATGVPEYKLTLIIAVKLKAELELRGYDVIMTRSSNDKAISCAARAKIANKAKANAYLRIHANGSSDSAVNGAMTMCTTKSNPYVPAGLYRKNKKLSTTILNSYVKATGAKKEFVWETDTMSGNNWSKVPTTIVEMGYMTNPKEDRNMQKKSYQKKMIQGLANGIDEFFK